MAGNSPCHRGRHFSMTTFEEIRRMIRTKLLAGLAPLPVFFSLVLLPRLAHAGIEACNNINIRAEAECKLETSGGCTAQCEPTRFEAACAGKLTASCDGQCTASADIECKGSCQSSCNTLCEINPGSFDCEGNCSASCDADCNARCSASAGDESASGACKTSCSANCSAKCDAQCSGTPPSATCEGKCEASCEGSCRGKASAQCQIDCHARLEGGCKAELQGGCKARCEKPEGALFCDGQYVDTGDRLKECVDALKAVFNIEVQGSASLGCSGNECSGEAEGSVSCAASPRSAPVLPQLALLAMIGATIARKARRGRRD
jgi:hypothetical protein